MDYTLAAEWLHFLIDSHKVAKVGPEGAQGLPKDTKMEPEGSKMEPEMKPTP